MQHQNNPFPCFVLSIKTEGKTKLQQWRWCWAASIWVVRQRLRVMLSVENEIAQGWKTRRVIYCHAAVKFVAQCSPDICHHVARNNTAVSVNGGKGCWATTNPVEMWAVKSVMLLWWSRDKFKSVSQTGVGHIMYNVIFKPPGCIQIQWFWKCFVNCCLLKRRLLDVFTEIFFWKLKLKPAFYL